MEARTCPNCGMGADDTDFCLDCGMKVDPEPAKKPSSPRHDRALRTRVIYKSPDELTALNLQKVLESEGIQSWLGMAPAPGSPGASWVEGIWGEILVFEDQELHALQTIETYFQSLRPGLH